MKYVTGFFYRSFMTIMHRFHWHYAPPIYPEGDTLLWCRWCGFRQVVKMGRNTLTDYVNSKEFKKTGNDVFAQEKLNRAKCDKCENPATHAARDIIELPSDTGWAEYTHYGDRRIGCDSHPVRRSRKYNLGDPDYPLTPP
jgi:hypothetical protein